MSHSTARSLGLFLPYRGIPSTSMFRYHRQYVSPSSFVLLYSKETCIQQQLSQASFQTQEKEGILQMPNKDKEIPWLLHNQSLKFWNLCILYITFTQLPFILKQISEIIECLDKDSSQMHERFKTQLVQTCSSFEAFQTDLFATKFNVKMLLFCLREGLDSLLLMVRDLLHWGMLLMYAFPLLPRILKVLDFFLRK